MSPRPKGPVQLNAARVASVAGDMSMAIVRLEAPRDRVAAWVRTLRDAADDLEHHFIPPEYREDTDPPAQDAP